MHATSISIAAAVISAYLTASFLQAVLHRWLGHVAVGSFFQRRHVCEHHRIYSPRHLVSARYSTVERSLTPYYGLPAGGLIALLCLVLPPAPLVAFTATMLLSFGAHAYLHRHYHLERSWLARLRWFRRQRELHYMHHRNPRRNYAVIDLFWDRLFGTFTETGRKPDRVGRP